MTAAIVMRPELGRTIEQRLAHRGNSGVAWSNSGWPGRRDTASARRRRVRSHPGIRWPRLPDALRELRHVRRLREDLRRVPAHAYVAFLLTLAAAHSERCVAHDFARTVLGAALAW